MINRSVTMHKKLAIIGASGHGRVIADIAELTEFYNEIVFLDDNPNVELYEYRYYGKSDDFVHMLDEWDFFVAIGNQKIRKKITEKLEKNGAFIATLIHPSAVIGSRVTIKSGTVIMPGTVINTNVKIGRSVILNTSSSVDHDCVLGDFVHIAVGAHLCGTVSVGESTWIGAGATVSNNVDICSDCMLGAGTVVVKNIEIPGVYFGVPAKIH